MIFVCPHLSLSPQLNKKLNCVSSDYESITDSLQNNNFSFVLYTIPAETNSNGEWYANQYLLHFQNYERQILTKLVRDFLRALYFRRFISLLASFIFKYIFLSIYFQFTAISVAVPWFCSMKYGPGCVGDQHYRSRKKTNPWLMTLMAVEFDIFWANISLFFGICTRFAFGLSHRIQKNEKQIN